MVRPATGSSTARTGPDGLRRFYDERPDLVILDVALPGLDGWQLIERFREFSRVPILMVTAHGSEAEKVRGLKLGADDYITKPLSLPRADRPRRGGPAPRGDERSRAAAPAAAPRPGRRPRRAPSPPAGRRDSPDADRVPAARLPRGARRPARDAPSDPRRGVGRRLRPRRPPAAHDDPEPPAPLDAVGSGRVVHHDRVRAGLQAHRSIRDPGQTLSDVEGSPR